MGKNGNITVREEWDRNEGAEKAELEGTMKWDR